MTLREKKIARLAKVMSYIELGLGNENHKSAETKAAWLLGLIEAHMDDVVREDLDDAIEKRNAANAGYTKAAH